MEKEKKKTTHKKTDIESNTQQPHQDSSKTPLGKRLYRSKTNQMIAGVCAGLGDYFNVDPTVVRLLFVLATVFGGYGIPVYIILWIILPEEADQQIGSEETVKKNVAELKSKAEGIAAGFNSESKEGRTRLVIGLILISLGLLFFFDNFGIFRADIFWPLILIAVGILLLRK